ncbi:hypothetical protein [Shewanella sp. YLB-07]|nr:hypothetical protein [Shewanella sp. YLB-07]
MLFLIAAQIACDDNEQWKMGLKAPGAEQNEQFLLNIKLWLSGKL